MSPDPVFEAVLQSNDASSVVLNPPGNNYQLHLALELPVCNVAPGARISGTAHAQALRVHRASGGGAFIEPVAGEPRIVAGRVLANKGNGTVLVRSAIPLLVEVSNETDQAACVPGEFVNFHVQSGMTSRQIPGQ